MKITFVACVALFAFMTACDSNAAVTSIPTIPTSTNTVAPTETKVPSPTVMLTPTATQYPPLSGEPPYLVIRQDFDAKELVIYDHDGGGRRVVELSKDRYFQELGQLGTIISPDGKWVAFYVGSVPVGGHLEHLPMTLYLLNIPDGDIRKIADVVMDGYQQKQKQVAENLKILYATVYKADGETDWVYGNTLMDFMFGIESVSWSPDSRYLAFAGQIDGISSDVYLYDLELNTIQRLTDDIQNVIGIRWSPDGNYLVLYNSIPRSVYPGVSLHILRPGDKVIEKPELFWSTTWGGLVDWLSPEVLLMTQGTDTAGSTDLQSININTGQIIHYWGDLYREVSLDHVNQVIALITSEYSPPETYGVYFIDFKGEKKLVLDGFYLDLVFRGGEKHRFLARKYSLQDGNAVNDLVAITLDGTTTPLRYIENYKISVSPDYSWLLIFNGQEVNLYDKNDEFLRAFPIEGMDTVRWKPDSSGLFFSTGEELYHLSVPDGKVSFIDRCLKNCYFSLGDFDSAWLP